MSTDWNDLLAKAMEENVAESVVRETVNPQIPHVPIVFLIDTSHSMEGPRIDAVNKHLAKFFDDITKEADQTSKTLRQSGDFAVITYGSGSVTVELSWTNGKDLTPLRPFTTDGDTPMGAALVKAGELLLDRFRAYNRDRAIEVLCGGVFNLTDGAPTDMHPQGLDHENRFHDELQRRWNAARSAIEVFEYAGSSGHSYVQFFQLGAPGYNPDLLNALSARPNRVHAIGEDMSQFFAFVKLSLSGLGQYPTIDDAIQSQQNRRRNLG